MPATTHLTQFHNDWIRIVDKAIFDYEHLTNEERLWFNVQSLIQSVNDGGITSYYYNPGSNHLADTMSDLETLGASGVVQLLHQVNQLFPDAIVPADIDQRNDCMAAWDDDATDNVLDNIDDLFSEEQEGLENLLVTYIVAHGLNITS